MVAGALGTRLAGVTSIGWGDARATSRLDLADGRRVAVRRYAGPGRADADRTAGIMAGVSARGVPVPDATVIQTASASWLVTPWLDGPLGSTWLDTPDRARTLAGSMGSLRRQVVALAPSVAAAAFGTSEATTPDTTEFTDALDPSIRRVVEAALGTIASRQTKATTFVHGDFAPINVVLATDGTIRALLDFEYARVGSPLEDVAWWGWVVRYHHPEAWAAAWPRFCEAAGVDPVAEAAEVAAFAVSELVRRASAASDERSRHGWLERIARTARFS